MVKKKCLSAQAVNVLPRLSGDGPRVLLRLRQLPDGFARLLERLLLLWHRARRYPLPATLCLLRGYIYHCTSDRSLAPSTIAGHLAAISDWPRRQLPHLSLAGRPTINPCKDESIGAFVAILERRIARPAKGLLPLGIPDFRAMLHRNFSLSLAFGTLHRLCVTFLDLGYLRRKAATALAVCDHRVSDSGAVSYAWLSTVRLLFDGELGCRYLRLRVDVQ
eukprot:jgi/Tetstr1/436613/TSEL_025409.t1